MLCMFGNQKAGNSAATLNLTEKTVSAQPTDKLVQCLADKQNEIDNDQRKKVRTKDETDWYRNKRRSINSLLLSESYLEVKTQLEDKNQRQLMICSVYKEFQNQITQFSAN